MEERDAHASTWDWHWRVEFRRVDETEGDVDKVNFDCLLWWEWEECNGMARALCALVGAG